MTDPERKRKIIGKTFIEFFESVRRKRAVGKRDKFLAQGTLYPDVIESVPIAGNPGGDDQEPSQRRRAAQEHEVQLVEPLKCLFKDEVR